jgi:hypothetical protein
MFLVSKKRALICALMAFALCLGSPLVAVAGAGSRSADTTGVAPVYRIVVFRLARVGESRARQGVPVNVYFNGRYHGSLLPDTRAIEILACPGSAEVNVLPGGVVGGDSMKRGQSARITAERGEAYYMQSAVDESGNAQIRTVDSTRASSVVAALPTQSHTVSRLQLEQCR